MSDISIKKGIEKSLIKDCYDKINSYYINKILTGDFIFLKEHTEIFDIKIDDYCFFIAAYSPECVNIYTHYQSEIKLRFSKEEKQKIYAILRKCIEDQKHEHLLKELNELNRKEAEIINLLQNPKH